MNKYPENIRRYLNRKFWIFDLDGTLTQPVHDFPAIRKTLGIPDGHDILGFVARQDEIKAKQLLDTLNNIEIELAGISKPAPGVSELMNELCKHNVNMGIITRNTRENARTSLERIGILSSFSPDCILGRDEAPPKPDPGGIHILLNTWNVKPDQAVMVGDYLFDLQAGRSAGTATVHVDRTGEFRWESMADVRVRSLESLAEQIRGTIDG